jgi:hypothetical protein
LRSDLYGLAYTSVAAIANQKTLCLTESNP